MCSVPLNTQVAEPKSDLSLWDERANNPGLTRAEMDAITAEQQALKAALRLQVKQLESEIREHKNTLSLGTGPLLPEEETVSKKASKQDPKRDQRQEFLRGEPPRMTIREYIEPVQQPDK